MVNHRFRVQEVEDHCLPNIFSILILQQAVVAHVLQVLEVGDVELLKGDHIHLFGSWQLEPRFIGHLALFAVELFHGEQNHCLICNFVCVLALGIALGELSDIFRELLIFSDLGGDPLPFFF